MDDRIKKSSGVNRENRATGDLDRQAPENKFVLSEERRKMFRSELLQEALPTPPKIPGFHLCWLSSTNQYDPIHKRLQMGYTPVKVEEVPGFENYRVKAGEHVGYVACNEMLLFKIPEDIYQEIMMELHHNMPLEEAEKIKVQQELLMDQRDSNGKQLLQIEGNGTNTNQYIKAPVFE